MDRSREQPTRPAARPRGKGRHPGPRGVPPDGSGKGGGCKSGRQANGGSAISGDSGSKNARGPVNAVLLGNPGLNPLGSTVGAAAGLPRWGGWLGLSSRPGRDCFERSPAGDFEKRPIDPYVGSVGCPKSRYLAKGMFQRRRFGGGRVLSDTTSETVGSGVEFLRNRSGRSRVT